MIQNIFYDHKNVARGMFLSVQCLTVQCTHNILLRGSELSY